MAAQDAARVMGLYPLVAAKVRIAKTLLGATDPFEPCQLLQ
jgi:hypothetical protein